ncbi:MAG: DinB family protein [Chloroflexi bacterium]|nr:DinB family protein [Chloroflexota bacterium]MCH8309019.1 DinB family protein [Chloroflexota bacterium]
MSNHEPQETLIAELDETVENALKYFTEVGQNSQARVGDWGAWEILCHMIYWHRATADGIESVASGNSPRQIEVETDEANARIIESMSGKTVEELAKEVRDLQARLVSAFRSIPDPTSTVFIRLSGAESSANERLQMIAGHWRGHVDELKDAN